MTNICLTATWYLVFPVKISFPPTMQGISKVSPCTLWISACNFARSTLFLSRFVGGSLGGREMLLVPRILNQMKHNIMHAWSYVNRNVTLPILPGKVKPAYEPGGPSGHA